MDNNGQLEILQAIQSLATQMDNNHKEVCERLDRVEARLDRVEARLDRVEIKLDKLEKTVDAIQDEVAGLKEWQTTVDTKLNNFTTVERVTKMNAYDIAELRQIKNPS